MYLAATVLTFPVKLLFRGVVHSFSKLCMKTQPFLVVQNLVATNNQCHAPKFFSEDRDITLCTISKLFLILQISTISLLLLFFVCLFGCVFTCFIIFFPTMKSPDLRSCSAYGSHFINLVNHLLFCSGLLQFCPFEMNKQCSRCRQTSDSYGKAKEALWSCLRSPNIWFHFDRCQAMR